MSGFEEYLKGLNPESAAAVSQFYGISNPNDYVPYDPNSPYGSINPFAYSGWDRKDRPGDQLYADIIRAQTQDYRNRFAPIEEYLADQITPTGTKQLEGDLARTREAFIGAGANVQGQQNRQMERYGVERNPGVANQNATVSALVGGLNETRMRDRDRRMAMLTGGLGALSQKARGSTA